MIIGTFSREADNYDYVGAIHAIGFERAVRFQRVVHKKTLGPDYLVIAHPDTEIGAGWTRTGKDGEYVSVKLESPFLPQAVNCALIGQPNGTLALVWHRDKPKEKPAASDTPSAA